MEGRLTKKQEAFITARMEESSDAAAAKRVPVGLTTVRKWKADSELFRKAYASAGTMAEKTRSALSVAQKASLQGYVQDLVASMPAVVSQLVSVALTAEKDADKLTAIKLIFEAVNFKAETSMPISKQNKVFADIMLLVAPQAKKIAQDKGIPITGDVQEVLEASFREIPTLEGLEEEEESA